MYYLYEYSHIVLLQYCSHANTFVNQISSNTMWIPPLPSSLTLLIWLVNNSWLLVEHLVSMTFAGYLMIHNPELKYLFFFCVCVCWTILNAAALYSFKCCPPTSCGLSHDPPTLKQLLTCMLQGISINLHLTTFQTTEDPFIPIPWNTCDFWKQAGVLQVKANLPI